MKKKIALVLAGLMTIGLMGCGGGGAGRRSGFHFDASEKTEARVCPRRQDHGRDGTGGNNLRTGGQQAKTGDHHQTAVARKNDIQSRLKIVKLFEPWTRQ